MWIGSAISRCCFTYMHWACDACSHIVISATRIEMLNEISYTRGQNDCIFGKLCQNDLTQLTLIEKKHWNYRFSAFLQNFGWQNDGTNKKIIVHLAALIFTQASLYFYCSRHWRPFSYCITTLRSTNHSQLGVWLFTSYQDSKKAHLIQWNDLSLYSCLQVAQKENLCMRCLVIT